MFIPLVLGALGLYYLATRKKSNNAVTTTGKSGTPYAIAPNARSTSTTQIIDVYLLPNGTPVMEFAVDVKSGKKTFLSSPMQANNPILQRARADLAV